MRQPTNRAGALAAVTICAAVVSCTYDFDQFVEPSQNATSVGSGGTGSQGGSMTSTGGEPSSSGGSRPVGATGGMTNASTAQACTGVSYGGICWYLSTTGASCAQTCASNGGTAQNMASFVGTTAQGGSLEKCTTLANLLGLNQKPVSGSRNDGLGLGCHVYLGVPWWLSSPAFSTGASLANSRLVCGCGQ